MKKLFVIALAFLATVSVNAQEKQFGPEKGDFGVEVQFNPFSENLRTFKIDGLKVRYNLSDKNAIRATIGFSVDNNTTRATYVKPNEADYPTVNAYNMAKQLYDKQLDDYTKTKYSTFSLDLGYERHLYQKGRVDLYAGAEIGIEKAWASSKSETVRGWTNVAGDAYTSWTINKDVTKGTNGTQNSSFGLNFAVFTGIDFYIVKGLYVGAELGLNLNSSRDCNIKRENTIWTSATNSTTTNTERDVKGRNFNANIDVNPALRIGWTF